MRPRRLVFSLGQALALASALAFADAARAQDKTPAAGTCNVTTPQGAKASAAEGETSGVRIVASGPDGKPLLRKRFFLLRASARNSPGIDFATAPRREDFLEAARRQGASPKLIEWLSKHDCDTIYCPEYEAEYAEAVKTVPEFTRAYEEGMRKYKNEKLALRWLTVNFPLKGLRTDYYRKKKEWLERAARASGEVTSAMTDLMKEGSKEKAVAHFVGVKPGTYYVSNLIPSDGGVLWDCQVTLPPPNPRLVYSVIVDMSAPKQQAAAAAPE